MKKTFRKSKLATKVLVAGMTIAVSVSSFAGCNKNNADVAQIGVNTESKVVTALNTVLNNRSDYADVISSSAVLVDQSNANSGYKVTIITNSGVEQTTLDSSLNVTDTQDVTSQTTATDSETSLQDIVEEKPTVETAEPGLTEKAYAKALEISGLTAEDVASLDFSEYDYMGQASIEVEIKTVDAKYTLVLDASTLDVYKNKINLKVTKEETTQDSSYITEESAVSVALETVGATSETVDGIKIKGVKDKGAKFYEVKFVYENYSYKVKINALSGKIVKFNKEINAETILTKAIETAIDSEKAEEIARSFIGDELKVAEMRKIKLDYEDGAFIYEIELNLNKIEYELEIDAATGEIVDVDFDDEDERKFDKNKNNGDHNDGDHDDGDHNDGDHDDDDKDDDRLAGDFISEEEAISKVLAFVNDETAFVTGVDIEKEKGPDGKHAFFYEIEVEIGAEEFSYRVDALSGEVTEDVDVDENDENKGEKPAKPGEGDKHGKPEFGKSRALEGALKAANVSRNQVKVHHIDFNEVNGNYEVSFSIKDINYNFVINGETGEVTASETLFE